MAIRISCVLHELLSTNLFCGNTPLQLPFWNSEYALSPNGATYKNKNDISERQLGAGWGGDKIWKKLLICNCNLGGQNGKNIGFFPLHIGSFGLVLIFYRKLAEQNWWKIAVSIEYWQVWVKIITEKRGGGQFPGWFLIHVLNFGAPLKNFTYFIVFLRKKYI